MARLIKSSLNINFKADWAQIQKGVFVCLCFAVSNLGCLELSKAKVLSPKTHKLLEV
jgi:hypothetical protein